jgi:hypothetical protein
MAIWNVMDLAAANGHLEVVHYRRYHRTEGCTGAARDDAVQSGEVEVSMWLHAHHTEGFHDARFSNAPLDSVRWLHETLALPVTEDAIIEEGDLPRLKWLCAHYRGPLTKSVWTVHSRLVPWLIAYSGHAISDWASITKARATTARRKVIRTALQPL